MYAAQKLNAARTERWAMYNVTVSNALKYEVPL